MDGKPRRSNVTVRNISANNGAGYFVFATGFAAAAAQILFLREYLSVFSGNELVIGVILALWLLATAAGSFAGMRLRWGKRRAFGFLFSASVVAGLLALRAVRLLFEPGEVIAPWYVPLIVLCTQSGAAFLGGFAFGRLAGGSGGGPLYSMENAGAAFGLAAVTLCIAVHIPGGLAAANILAAFVICTGGLLPAVANASRGEALTLGGSPGRIGWLIAALVLIAAFVTLDPHSVRWKYCMKVRKVVSGLEGEIAFGGGESGTMTLLNNTVYRAGMPLPSIEQAVHAPAAMLRGPLRRALVIGNAGHVTQLEKYRGLSIECLETEPLLAVGGCAHGAVETRRTGTPFDLILLGAGMPATAQTSRFYTLSFFRKMRRLAGDSGVFSFTLPMSENYLSPDEKKLKDLLQVTLHKAFRHVTILPGSGYTFAASDLPLRWPLSVSAPTDYFEAYTLASLTPGRVALANGLRDSLRVNTAGKPEALWLGQKQWLSLFGVSPLLFGALLVVALGIAVAISPRSGPALSVGTTGFAAGVYSVALLLLYQFSHGTLYSRIPALMIAVTAGFALGGRVKRFPFSDALIGLYAAATLSLLAAAPYPPLALFLFFHFGMGFLAGAQFASRTGAPWGGLYAADLAGGVFGMALCSTLLVPSLGVFGVAAGIGAIKLASAAFPLLSPGGPGKPRR